MDAVKLYPRNAICNRNIAMQTKFMLACGARNVFFNVFWQKTLAERVIPQAHSRTALSENVPR
jgi:hypothetical protein